MKRAFKLIGAAGMIAAAVASMSAWPSAAQVSVPGQPLVPLGYCQLTSIDASTLLSSCAGFPATATLALIQPEAQAIRYRDDGTAPLAGVGYPLAVGASLLYAGTLSKVRVISQTSGAKLNVLFYR